MRDAYEPDMGIQWLKNCRRKQWETVALATHGGITSCALRLLNDITKPGTPWSRKHEGFRFIRFDGDLKPSVVAL